jgi:hypothetical protein
VGLQRADDTKEQPAGVEEAARDLSHLQRVEVVQAYRVSLGVGVRVTRLVRVG